MELTEKQYQKALTKLNEIRKEGCYKCGFKDFYVDRKLYKLKEFHFLNADPSTEVTVMPMMIAICKECGDINFISPIVLGVLDEYN